MELKSVKQRYAILGASRGLGAALYQNLFKTKPEAQFLLVSRKINTQSSRVQTYKTDFSLNTVDDLFFQKLKDFDPTHIIYCAGGGPYGKFQDKKWSDHTWAMNVNFNSPAQLLHLISNSEGHFENLKSMTFVGSRIAEASPDKMASSYAAAKHALKGLVTTVQAEASLKFKTKLFSPGYILTDLLPAHSAPRLENKAQPAESVASQLVQFIDSNLDLS